MNLKITSVLGFNDTHLHRLRLGGSLAASSPNIYKKRPCIYQFLPHSTKKKFGFAAPIFFDKSTPVSPTWLLRISFEKAKWLSGRFDETPTRLNDAQCECPISGNYPHTYILRTHQNFTSCYLSTALSLQTENCSSTNPLLIRPLLPCLLPRLNSRHHIHVP